MNATLPVFHFSFASTSITPLEHIGTHHFLLMVFTELLSTLWAQFVVFARPMFKWLLHKVSGKCELLRITYEEQPGVTQIKRIEKSLQRSRLSSLKQLSRAERVDVDQSVRQVVQLKQIVTDVHVKFEDNLRRCISYICGYNHLLAQVDGHRKVKYSSENAEHEAKLIKLWELYKPDTPLDSRVGEQWGEIGFQGTDPATDFRGMGVLGLDQLLYFADKYSQEAQGVLLKSRHPKYWFSFAIVGINISQMQYQLMAKRKLRTHFYNQPNPRPTMDDYHEVYCYLLWEFTKFWFQEKPRDVMEFNRIRDKFQRHVLSLLKDPDAVLTADFQRK